MRVQVGVGMRVGESPVIEPKHKITDFYQV